MSLSGLPSRYQIVADLNQGSYGLVRLAKDTKHANKLVAIKSIRSNLEAKQEIAIHAKLGSGNKHICQLLDSFEVGDETFLVMDYYQQGDLYEAIRAGRGPRENGNIREFMLQLVDAVIYCHSKGIYHRDIKPENVLLDDQGNVKLADFGLATTRHICHDFGVGSERYMAPELFDEEIAKEYNAAKADIWSIGICLLNILFSRNPFTVACGKDKLFIDFASNREALFDIFPTLSADGFAVLRHCLTLDPDNRSLEKMRQELISAKNWTIDDDYDYEEDYEEEEEEDYEEEEYVEAEYTEDIGDIITTTQNREPLRTPSIAVAAAKVFVPRSDWSRTMQFTPPAHSPLHSRYSRSPAAMKMMHQKKPLSGLRHFSMESVDESEEDEKDTTRAHEATVEEEEVEEAAGGYDSQDDIFVMDMNTSLSKMNVRNSSDSGSIDSVPSLVQSTSSYSSSLPAFNIPVSKTPPNRDYLKFGTPWSDMADMDDFEDEFLDDEDDDFTAVQQIKKPLLPGSFGGFEKMRSVPGAQQKQQQQASRPSISNGWKGIMN